MKSIIYIIIGVGSLLMSLTACDRDAHEGDNGLTVTLDNSSCPTVPIEGIMLYLFDADGNRVAGYAYTDAQALGSSLLAVEAGHYTVVAVVNTVPDEEESRSLTALHEWVTAAVTDDSAGNSGNVSGCIILSGSVVVDVAGSGITRATVSLRQEAFPLPKLRILLTLPEPHLPDYTAAQAKGRAAEAGYILRCVAELYPSGTAQYRGGRSKEPLLRRVITPTLQADGKCYLIELEAAGGNYDLRLWTDYARAERPFEDTYYHTENLQAITLVTAPEYTANTDAKDAAYRVEQAITLPEAGTEIRIALQRPLAKYRILANDVPGYRRLTEIDATRWPPLEELSVAVYYENFFPSTFNILNDNPTDALTGIRFSGSLPAVGDEATELQVASDWVMVNGKESSVSVTVVVTDGAGRVVSSTSGILIPYRRSFLTTIRGDFLTGGVSGGGIRIDTDWEGSFEVWF